MNSDTTKNWVISALLIYFAIIHLYLYPQALGAARAAMAQTQQCLSLRGL